MKFYVENRINHFKIYEDTSVQNIVKVFFYRYYYLLSYTYLLQRFLKNSIQVNKKYVYGDKLLFICV